MSTDLELARPNSNTKLLLVFSEQSNANGSEGREMQGCRSRTKGAKTCIEVENQILPCLVGINTYRFQSKG